MASNHSRPAVAPAVPAVSLRRQVLSRRWQELRRFVRYKPLGAAGAAVVLIMIFMAFFGSYVAPYDPIEMSFPERLQAPNAKHWFGTDLFGRDILSNIIAGANNSVTVAFVAVAIGTGIGAIWGVTSGYMGGRFDLISQRLIDIKQSIPTLAVALVIVASLGSSQMNVVIAIAIGLISSTVRVVRSQAISVRHTTFIDASVSIGASTPRIVLVHVLPNCLAPYLIVATTALGAAILTEASLSFLGVGVPPPTPSWGRMLSGLGRDFLTSAPWMSLAPGLALTIVVLAFNLFGDAVRDILDPRLRGSGRR